MIGGLKTSHFKDKAIKYLKLTKYCLRQREKEREGERETFLSENKQANKLLFVKLTFL